MAGAPVVVALSSCTAPVHINVGGTSYTSSLETLTRFPHSKLAKYFNGSLPIVVDPEQRKFFFDRDGKTFRHVLNFLRNSKLILPDNFGEINLLLEEAIYFEIEDLRQNIQQFLDDKMQGYEETEDTSCSEEENMNQCAKKNKKKRSKKKRHLEKTNEAIQDTSGEMGANSKDNGDFYKIAKDNKSNIGQNHGGERAKEKSKQMASEKNGEPKGKTDKGKDTDGGKLTIMESVGGNDIVCVMTNNSGGVEEVWCSDESCYFRYSGVYLEQHLNKNLYYSCCLGSDTCYNCKVKESVTCINVRGLSGKFRNLCIQCARSNSLNGPMSDFIWFESHSKMKVGFPKVAKFLLSKGYKLVTTSADQGIIYHCFVN